MLKTRSPEWSLPPASVHSPIETNASTASEQEQLSEVPALTARMSRGEETAFSEFFQLYFNRLLRYLLVLAGGNEGSAREALQVTFVRVARHVRQFESESAFWNWLTVLGRSSITDERRKHGRYLSLLDRFFRQAPQKTKGAGDAEARFAELLDEEMGLLSADERELLERRYFERDGVRKLAEECRVTEKAMESRLLRIRRKLKTAVLNRLHNETTD